MNIRKIRAFTRRKEIRIVLVGLYLALAMAILSNLIDIIIK